MSWMSIFIYAGVIPVTYFAIRLINLFFNKEIKDQIEELEALKSETKEHASAIEANAKKRIADAYAIEREKAELAYADKLAELGVRKEWATKYAMELDEQRIKNIQDRLKADAIAHNARKEVDQIEAKYQSILKAFHRKKTELDAIKLFLDNADWTVEGKTLTKNKLTALAKEYANNQKESQL